MTFIVCEEDYLAHHGVKGMHWGVRKERPLASPSPKPSGFVVRTDGSIDIRKGVALQRLVRSNGQSAPLKNLTYASFTKYDNARYIKIIGSKGMLGGGRDRILTITTTKAIKAPSHDVATRIVSNLMLNNEEFRKHNTSFTGASISKGDLQRIRSDPNGKTAKTWYNYTNTKLVLDQSFDSNVPYIQKTMKAVFLKNGFNALRDENDFSIKYSKAPIIIFNPETSLKVTKVTDITDELRKANKAQLKEYKKNGKDWINQQIYSG